MAPSRHAAGQARGLHGVNLRPATAADYDMLYALHSAAMRAHVERIWGWDETLQSEMFRSRFDPSAIQVIQYDAQAIGMLSVEKRERDLFIRQIQLLPAYQNRGIGERIVRDVLEEGRSLGKPASLRVLRHNPAIRLYERLGFRVVSETETHLYMSTAEGDASAQNAIVD